MNDRIEKISIDFNNTEEQLEMHIMKNMCQEYKELKLVIENKGSYLDDLEELKITIQDHWDTYYCYKDTDNDSDDE